MTQRANIVIADLQGGPATFPDELRHPEVSATQEKIKVSHYGGHEHFERDPHADNAVYHWIGRTRVAE